jgi:hypothetical protein
MRVGIIPMRHKSILQKRPRATDWQFEDVMTRTRRNKRITPKPNSRILKTCAILFFVGGVALRISLCWSNPPLNAFDDHYEPILMMMDSGSIPAKDACWQCYHPPVFYVISAMLGKPFMASGFTIPQVEKLLQFVNCSYGILTLVFIYLILEKFLLPELSKVIAFGVACFLPRHIYMSAMNSNDAISYLFVAMSVYLLIITIERKLSVPSVLAASIVISIALFTKYTTYALLPATIVPLAILYFKNTVLSRRTVVIKSVTMLVLPGVLLAGYFISNYRHYGDPVPWNVKLEDPSLEQPRDYGNLDFVSFKPWDGMVEPIIVPDKMHSFWTLLYNGMWFDNQPKFLLFLDSNSEWWMQYYAWLRGNTAFPGENNSVSSVTRLSGMGLLGLGLLPLFLLLKGSYCYVQEIRDHWREGQGVEIARMSVFPSLLIANAAIMIGLALRLPVYSAVKPSYFLNSLPVFAIFFSYGFAFYKKSKNVTRVMVVITGLLFALVSVHIFHICWALYHHVSRFQTS